MPAWKSWISGWSRPATTSTPRAFKVLRGIIIPLVKPGIIAGSILVFIPALGAYVTPSILGGGKNLMIGNLIELQFGQGRNWPLGSALSIT
jgi:spermidine/putrescine transport system permease protein